MPATVDAQLVSRYLDALRSLLGDLYREPVRITAIDLQEGGSVAGIFLGDESTPYQFEIAGEDVSYQRTNLPRRSDSGAIEVMRSLVDLPLSLESEAYASGMLEVFARSDAAPRKRKPARCKIGDFCNGTCIQKGDRCRVKLGSPLTVRKVKDVVEAGQIVYGLGGNDLIKKALGVAAIGSIGFIAGLSVGAGLATKAPPIAPPPPTPPREPRKAKEEPVTPPPMETVVPPAPPPEVPKPEPIAVTTTAPKKPKKPKPKPAEIPDVDVSEFLDELKKEDPSTWEPIQKKMPKRTSGRGTPAKKTPKKPQGD